MPDAKQAALLALDWGTSSLRAYLLNGAMELIACRDAGQGIMHLPLDGFAGALGSLCGDWLGAQPELPVIASGMVGSAQGWMEVPYVAAPASIDALAGGIRYVTGPQDRRIALVPGVMQDGDKPNVMRGEETQVAGALAVAPDFFAGPDEHLIVLPGTHSKWVRVREGRIVSFLTFMTGELYAVLRHHSLLGRLMRDDCSDDPQAFELGLSAAEDSEAGALSALFSVRTLGLTGRLHPSQLGEYLSGLLIGHEIREARHLLATQFDATRPLALVGAEDLCRRYALALQRFGVPVHGKDFSEATAAGLWQIASRAGLVKGEHATC
jgi:2-dehydro-3-deoxygalactonokinase